ncbi:MAG: hypothetical protein JHC33_10760 [Ignisphaera sp.]|nr:hypothetical protein [Ignisphaera sp.]
MFGSQITTYAIGILLALVIAEGVVINYEHHRVTTLTSQVAVYAAAEKTYLKEISDSNASILAYQDESKKRQADSAAAQEAIKPQVIKYEKKAIEILSAKPATSNICTSTEQLFNDYLAGRNQ